MKEKLKPYVYKQLEVGRDTDSVLFVERSGELWYIARLSTKGMEPKRERV